jgi:hypothetical protein
MGKRHKRPQMALLARSGSRGRNPVNPAFELQPASSRCRPFAGSLPTELRLSHVSAPASVPTATVRNGITEDIITELSRSRSLFVIARNSSFQFLDKAIDVRRIARDLGVRYVVEGSVRKMGSRIRITAQLEREAICGSRLIPKSVIF